MNIKRLIKKANLALIAQCLEETIVVEDMSGNVLFQKGNTHEDYNYYPIKISNETVGFVKGSQKATHIAELLSLHAERELEITALTDETLTRYKEITFLYEFSESVATCQDVNEVARLVIEQIKQRQFITADNLSIMLTNEGQQALEVVAAYGEEFEPKIMLKSGFGIAGNVFANGRAEIVNDTSLDDRFIQGQNLISSLICAPLKIKDRCIGVINVSSTEPYEYKAEDLKFVSSIASYAAGVIESVKLYEELKDAFITTVYTLAETIEKRDPYTAGHTRRVSSYSIAIGLKLGMSQDSIQRLELAAILHDIGKIGVRDSVLLKTNKLTDEEFALIKRHSIYGEEILSHIKAFKDIIPGVRQHHERFNGTGYPDGLKGNEIDIMARIIAVADAFDAMTSDRPYRKGMSLEIAVNEIKKSSGTQFDPAVVEVFLQLYEQKKITKLEG